MKRILVADDEAVILLQLEDALANLGFEVVATASTAADAVALARRHRPHAVLMDIVMPGPMDGIEGCRTIQEELGIPVVLISAYSDQAHMERARAAAPAGYVVKPFQPDQVAAMLNVAALDPAQSREYRTLSESLGDGDATDTLLAAVLESADIGVAVCDAAGAVRYVNRRLRDMLPASAPLPATLDGLPGPTDDAPADAPVLLDGAEGEPVLAQVHFTDLAGQGTLAVYTDVSALHRTQCALERHERILDAKTRIADAFLTVSDADVYSRVATVLTDCFLCDHAYFAYLDRDGNLVVPSFTGPIWDRCAMTEKMFVFPPEAWGGCWGRSLTERTTVVRNEGLALPEGHLHLDNAMAVPILHRHRVIGQFVLADRPGGFTPEDAEGLEAVAAYSAPILRARLERENMEKERAQASLDLMHSEERYRTIVETSLEGIWTIDATGRTTYANRNVAGMLGTTPEAMLGTHCFEYMPGESIPEAERRLARCREGYASQFDFLFRHASGSGVWAIVSMSPLAGTDREYAGALVMTSDITFRKFAEDSLKESEERFRQLVENLDEVYWIREFDSGMGLYASPNFEDVWGLPGRAFTERPFAFLEAVHPADRDRVRGAVEAFQADPAPYSLEFRIATEAGGQRWIRLSASPVRDDTGRPYRVVGVSQDITAGKRAGAERDRLARAIEQLEEIVLITDPWGTVQYANQAYERISGQHRAQLLGRNIGLLRTGGEDADYLRDLTRALRDNEAWTGHYEYHRKDGSVREVKATISPILDDVGSVEHYVSVQRDVTDELRLERQLGQARKMEALGTLAGGIAHDFNNILMAIMGFTELALRATGPESPQARHLERVLQGGERARELVQQILAFSRRGEVERTALELAPLVKETVALVSATLPANITLKRNISARAGTVLAAPAQIHQVVMNLCANAVHALEHTGGTITVRLDRVQAPGNGGPPLARLRVEDDGPGVPENIADRVFDPFFTTKAPGRGTGMGLSVVHGTVTGLGGSVALEPPPGGGARFTVLLPAAQREAVPLRERAACAGGNAQRILFVDDEQDITALAADRLAELGFRPDARTSPTDALTALRAAPAAYDALVTDQSMPGLSGLELARAATTLRPDLPVVLCTGYSRRAVQDKLEEHGVARMLMKPYTFDELAALLCDLLPPDEDAP